MWRDPLSQVGRLSLISLFLLISFLHSGGAIATHVGGVLAYVISFTFIDPNTNHSSHVPVICVFPCVFMPPPHASLCSLSCSLTLCLCFSLYQHQYIWHPHGGPNPKGFLLSIVQESTLQPFEPWIQLIRMWCDVKHQPDLLRRRVKGCKLLISWHLDEIEADLHAAQWHLHWWWGPPCEEELGKRPDMWGIGNMSISLVQD